jgi:hypothetical protein
MAAAAISARKVSAGEAPADHQLAGFELDHRRRGRGGLVDRPHRRRRQRVPTDAR